MRKYWVLFLFFALQCLGQGFKFHNGDIIFQETSDGSFNQSIQEVTKSIGDYQFTHVGMVYIDGVGKQWVLEATRPYTRLTPIVEFLYPSQKGKTISVVTRLKETYRPLIQKALDYGFTLIGKPYDEGFKLNNDAYYCSELIYEILKKANHDQPVFKLNVMTFKSKKNGQLSKGWEEHFKKFGLPIPEGEMGINPGAMSQVDFLDVLQIYISPKSEEQ